MGILQNIQLIIAYLENILPTMLEYITLGNEMQKRLFCLQVTNVSLSLYVVDFMLVLV